MARPRVFVCSLVLVAIGSTISACTTASNAAKTGKQASTTSTSTSTSTIVSAPTTTTAAAPPSGQVLSPRQFTITGVSASSTNWLTVELHPATAPIQLQATSTSPLEVCPANLDGTISGSGSWPPSFKFVSCLPLDAA